MFRIIKYIILLLLVVAMIYFLRVRFRNNEMEIKLKTPDKIEGLKQRTIKLKNEFNLFEKEGPKKTETAPEKLKGTVSDSKNRQEMDNRKLDRFIREHSN